MSPTSGINDHATGLPHNQVPRRYVPYVNADREVCVYAPGGAETHVQRGRPERSYPATGGRGKRQTRGKRWEFASPTAQAE